MQLRMKPTAGRNTYTLSFFSKLSREISKEHCRGPFPLYCDDLRPDNVLVDASRLVVTEVVDWEFA